MRLVRPPRIEPAPGLRILDWMREAQATFREISAAFGEIRLDRHRPAPSLPASSSTPSHPFQLLTRPKPGASGTTQGGIVYESTLFQSLRPNHKYPIEGLLSADKSSGWFDLIGNDAIWLGVTFDTGGAITWAGIDSWGEGKAFNVTVSAWSGTNGYCEDDGGDPARHQTSRKLIAYTVAGSEGDPVPHQVMFRDQILREIVINGRPARYPFAHEGGYPL